MMNPCPAYSVTSTPSSFYRLIYRLLVLLCAASLFACTKFQAPDVSFTDLTGHSIRLASLKGKPVLVNFWATSCSTCVAEMPSFVKTYEQFHTHGLEFFAVAMSYDPPNYVINFTESRKLPFPVVLDVEGKLAKAFDDVNLTPTTFLIDEKGDIVKKYVGAPDFEQLEELIKESLGR